MVPGEFGTLIARFEYGEGMTLDVRMSGRDLRAGSDAVPPERILAWDSSGHLEWVSDGARAMFANANAVLVSREANRGVNPPEAHVPRSRETLPDPDPAVPEGHITTAQFLQDPLGGSESNTTRPPGSCSYPFLAGGLVLVMGVVVYVVIGMTLESRANAEKLFEATGDTSLLRPSASLWSEFGPLLFSYLVFVAIAVFGPLAITRLGNRGADAGRAVKDDAGLARLMVRCLVGASAYVLVGTALVGLLAPAVFSWRPFAVGSVLLVLAPSWAVYWLIGTLGPRAFEPIPPSMAPWARWPRDGWALAVGYSIPLSLAFLLLTRQGIGYDYMIPVSRSLRLAILLIVPVTCQIIGVMLARPTLSALLRIAGIQAGRSGK